MDLPFSQRDAKAIAETGPGALIPAAGKAFTGLRLSDEQKEAILAKFAAGKTRAEIAKEMRLSRNSVSFELRRAEKDGRLPEVRQRLAERLEDLCEDHLELRLRNPKGMTAIDFGIYTDKLQLLRGAPTSIVAVAKREDEAAVLADLQRLAEGFIEVETTVVPSSCTPTTQLP